MIQKSKEKLNILVEEQYSNTNWYIMIMQGIRQETDKRGIELNIITKEDLYQFPSKTIIILIGSSLNFMETCINCCIESNMRPIVAGFEISSANIEISYVTINRYHAMVENIRNLIACNATRIALLGINSSIQTDLLRLKAWKDMVEAYGVGDPETDVFYADNGLEGCILDFLDKAREYDAVACTNDYSAIYLLAHAPKHSIKIPDHLMVTGFGNIYLSQFTNPPLTTISLNLHEVGEQVFKLYRNLSKNEVLLSCSATINSQIIARETTKKTYKEINKKVLFKDSIATAFEPSFEKCLKPLYKLEESLAQMDELDYKIINGLINDIPYDKLSEMIFLSNSALRYRLKKIFSLTGCDNKSALTKVLKKYLPNFHSEEIEFLS